MGVLCVNDCVVALCFYNCVVSILRGVSHVCFRKGVSFSFVFFANLRVS